MAIYYLNPYTQTNGTGTFASPYSPSSTSRTAWASGDELRILGNTVPLFLPTVYTATKTTDQTFTITSGGGLGADFAAGNYVYFVEYDTFVYISGVAVNTMTAGSTAPMPWANTSLSSTVTVREVDIANNGTSVALGTMYILGSGVSSNVIVTDGWINANTRVTDGSVKCLFRGAGATSSPTFYFETSSTISTAANNNFDMRNSHVVPNPRTSSSGSLNIRGRDSVYNINQFGTNTTSTSTLVIGTTAVFSPNNIITIKSLNNYYTIVESLYGDNNTINVNNYYAYFGDGIFGFPGSPMYASNTTINFTSYVQAITTGASSYYYSNQGQSPKITINAANATYDFVSASAPTYYVYGGGADITLRPPATVYSSRRATLNPTKPSYRLYYNGNQTMNKTSFYTANIAPGTAITNTIGVNGMPASFSTTTSSLYSPDLKKPFVFILDFESSANSSNCNGSVSQTTVNVLQTYRDGSGPVEILGIEGNYQTTSAGSTSFPNVTRDQVTYRTTGPSLRSTLASRNANYWVTPSLPISGVGEKSASYKNIKLPIISGSVYTITGYIRSSYASSTTGDVIMSVIYNNNVLATQNMTSAIYNSWEQFTLSFTATATGEAYIVWEMYYPAGSMSYWLDDLTISKA